SRRVGSVLPYTARGETLHFRAPGPQYFAGNPSKLLLFPPFTHGCADGRRRSLGKTPDHGDHVRSPPALVQQLNAAQNPPASENARMNSGRRQEWEHLKVHGSHRRRGQIWSCEVSSLTRTL